MARNSSGGQRQLARSRSLSAVGDREKTGCPGVWTDKGLGRTGAAGRNQKKALPSRLDGTLGMRPFGSELT